MELSFDYVSILERCKALSSYEGRNAVDGDGESAYLKTSIAEQDEVLVSSYINQGAHIIEDRIGKCISESTYTDDGFTINMKGYIDEWHKTGDSIRAKIFDALVNYAMRMWMDYNSNSRSESYGAVFTDMLDNIVHTIYRKKAPHKRKYVCPNTKETEVTIS